VAFRRKGGGRTANASKQLVMYDDNNLVVLYFLNTLATTTVFAKERGTVRVQLLLSDKKKVFRHHLDLLLPCRSKHFLWVRQLNSFPVEL
jgi:hypothetical protein